MIKLQLIPTGMPNLDHLLGGGFPPIPDVAICGSEEDIRSFAHQLLWNRLNAGDTCLYASLSQTREEVHADLVSKGWEVAPFIEKGALRIVDYFSLADKEPQKLTEKIEALYAMEEKDLVPEKFYQVLAKEFYRLKGGKAQRFLVMLDSVDRAIGLMGIENAFRLREMVSNLFKDTNSVGIVLLCSEYVPEEIYDWAKTAASVLIELKHEGNGQQMVRVTKNLYTDWTPLT